MRLPRLRSCDPASAARLPRMLPGRSRRSARGTTSLHRAYAAAARAVSVVGTVVVLLSLSGDPLASAAVASRPAAPAAARPMTVATTLSLRGRTVVLDAGHNGANASHAREISRRVPAGGFLKACNTTGTATASGYAEHAFAFDVTARLAALPRARGATVVLTRTDDAGVGPCVDARARTGNAARADAVVSVHADGGPPAVRGFHVIEPALAPDGGNRRILATSATLGGLLRDRFAAVTGEPLATYPGGLVAPGLARRRDLAALNLSRVPVALIECGNMRNPVDAARMRSAAGRQRIAAGIAAGIEAFLQR